MPAKVSILIPFYNCPYVDRAIESALQQTYPDVEVIVIEDGSSKHLPLIKPYAKHIRYIRKPNGGTASALNRGSELPAGLTSPGSARMMFIILTSWKARLHLWKNARQRQASPILT
jgi:glycosyltransferase involved in cell wall biosynthesis